MVVDGFLTPHQTEASAYETSAWSETDLASDAPEIDPAFLSSRSILTAPDTTRSILKTPKIKCYAPDSTRSESSCAPTPKSVRFTVPRGSTSSVPSAERSWAIRARAQRPKRRKNSKLHYRRTPFASKPKCPFAGGGSAKCPFGMKKRKSFDPDAETEPKTHKTPRRKYVSTKPTWVWNWEAYVVVAIYFSVFSLALLAEVYAESTWIVYTMRAVTSFSVIYVLNEWKNWCQMFSWREPRSHPDCISHTMRPVPGTATPRHRFRQLPGMKDHQTYQRGLTPKTPANHYNKKRRTGRMPKHAVGCSLPDDLCNGSCLSTADRPDMDHIYLPFSDYLWTSIFVLPAMELGNVIGARCSVGVIGILWHRFKQWVGLNAAYDEEAVKKAIVETFLGFSLLVWAKKDGDILTYKVPAMTHIDSETGKVTAGDLVLRLNSVTREYLGCTYRKEEVSPAAALGLLMNAFAGHSHPLLHGYASWGVNVESENWFIRRMSIITVKFNNLGVEAWPFMVGFLSWLGLCRTPLTEDNTRLTIHLNHNVPEHASKMHEMLHIPYVQFVTDVRKYFMKQFDLYLGDFEGIDAEALFVGTVLHSIDHRVVAKNFSRLLLTAEHAVEPKFAADVEWGLYTCNLATDAPLGRPYENRFSHAAHPFFRKVFAFANEINPELASYMEACIAI